MIIGGKHSIVIILLAFFAAVGHLYGQEGSSASGLTATLSSAVADSSSQGLSAAQSSAVADSSSEGPSKTSIYYQEELSSPWSVGTDLVSGYIWRGTRQGSGPHIQPAIEFSRGTFSAGAWGTFDLNSYEEVDLWFAFDLPGGFAIGMQDYYLPELPYFDYSAADGAHAFEVNLDWESENVWLSANCIINEAGGVGSYGGDLYFEAGFSFEYFSVFMGAGNGWHTEGVGFTVCNLGLEVGHELEITENFSIPVTGQLIFNPDREQLLLTVGFSF